VTRVEQGLRFLVGCSFEHLVRRQPGNAQRADEQASLHARIVDHEHAQHSRGVCKPRANTHMCNRSRIAGIQYSLGRFSDPDFRIAVLPLGRAIPDLAPNLRSSWSYQVARSLHDAAQHTLCFSARGDSCPERSAPSPSLCSIRIRSRRCDRAARRPPNHARSPFQARTRRRPGLPRSRASSCAPRPTKRSTARARRRRLRRRARHENDVVAERSLERALYAEARRLDQGAEHREPARPRRHATRAT